ncbi:rhamnulokinase [Gorillibacterium sp. sgz500922]|uniref:rhamnulokinase n=1 Tax=Gorillibacterium sp. sgz500922 TaxID=3446694 RepID=UPI003F6698BF
MGDAISMLAVDLGASSGRVIRGTFDGKALRTEEIRRFVNEPVRGEDSLCWNVPQLFEEIKEGIRTACSCREALPVSLSVDTWGVDYGLLDRQGRLLAPPRHYRDGRMERHRRELESLLPPEEQFRLTGNQPAAINTVYQLFADARERGTLVSDADRLLLMPDLFLYLLSGRAAAERTILSTSGLADPLTGEPASEVFARLGLPERLIAPRVASGTVVGELRPELQEELGCGPLRLIAGASHDTAAAVAALPGSGREDAAFISCGTWSLVGMETERPLLREEAYRRGFTNEGCHGGGNRLLKNITGLWLLQEMQRTWAAAGEPLGFGALAELAAAAEPSSFRLDPDDPRFAAPGDMPERIAACCREAGQQPPASKGAMARLVLESLADSYSRAVRELEQLTGRTVRTVRMMGGGVQNRLLCQLTADACGREVAAGPVEASSLGNLLVQLEALGRLKPGQAGELAAAAGVAYHSPRR